MKPDWNTAPKWANWLAMDADGDWYWYSHQPILRESSWQARIGTKMDEAISSKSGWAETAESRP